MRPAGRSVLLALASLMVIAPGPARGVDRAGSPQVPTFRAEVNAVVVDVSVRDRSRRPLTNLRAADFQVTDNGVPQQVDNVSYGKLPIDVTVALDVSYSVTGSVLERLRRAVGQLMRDLRREDRLKLILFNMRVTRIVDFTSDADVVDRAIRSVTAGGGTGLLDAISVALVSASTPERRQLLVFFTDGNDSTSVTAPETLTSVAQRTRGTVTFVMPPLPQPIRRPSAPGSGGLQQSPLRPLAPVLSAIAVETGGTVLPVGEYTDLTGAFRRVLDDFRSAYVLYYTPRGVDRGGYHALDVRVKHDGATVQARRGYWF
jgi:Ca-activated chloride channel family protein